MTHATQVKRAWNYERDVPRCENCANYKRAHMLLVNSLPRKQQPFCKKGSFNVKPNDCCDRWQDRQTLTGLA